MFSFLRETSSLVSFDMIRVILKMRPKMALIDPSPFKGPLFRTNVGGVSVLVFCTLSGDVLYLYTVS